MNTKTQYQEMIPLYAAKYHTAYKLFSVHKLSTHFANIDATIPFSFGRPIVCWPPFTQVYLVFYYSDAVIIKLWKTKQSS